MASFIWRVSSIRSDGTRHFWRLHSGASLKAFAVVFRAAIAVVLKQRNGVVDLFLDGERTIADATVAQREAGLLQEVFFLPHRQFVLLRQFDRRRRADFFAASTEDAASKIKLPRQLTGGEVGFNR
ncbi:Uncharacterised protein [Escherichia coli]|uniref:Uncharacterized protein n=1 Tax=Escherichia coli TaxID=562 RepID=A0A377D6D5_ECOLX|nr:Uncharacterised protein [Escherichia coli]